MNITKRETYSLTKALLKPINTAAIVILGLYTVVWGLWLANPFWTVLDAAPVYDQMRSLFPEVVWGIIAIVCGLVTIYGAYRPSYRALIFGSSVAWAHWFMIAIFYFLGDWRSTAGISSLAFAVYAGFIYLNIKVNYRSGQMQLEDIVP